MKSVSIEKVVTNMDSMEGIEMKGILKLSKTEIDKELNNISLVALFEADTERMISMIADHYSHRNLSDIYGALNSFNGPYSSISDIVREALIRKGTNALIIGSFGISSFLDIIVSRKEFKIAGDFVDDQMKYVALYNRDGDMDRLVAFAILDNGQKVHKVSGDIAGFDEFCAFVGAKNDIIKPANKLARGYVCSATTACIGKIYGYEAFILSDDFRLLPGVFIPSSKSMRVCFLDGKQAYGVFTYSHFWSEPGNVRRCHTLEEYAYHGDNEDQILIRHIGIYGVVSYTTVYRIIAMILLLKNHKQILWYQFDYDIHHIDGDHSNNDPSNLCLLHKEVHRRVHSRDLPNCLRDAIVERGRRALN